MPKEFEHCPICKKYVQEIYIEKHHVIPLCVIKNNNIIYCCSTCHDMIHYYIPINEIKNYHTYELIISHPDMATYINWIHDKNNPGNWKIKKILKNISIF